MDKELTRKITDLFNSGVDNVREFRIYTFKFLGTRRSRDWIITHWDRAWGDDSNVPGFVKELSSEEKKHLLTYFK